MIPALTYGFVRYAQHQEDVSFLQMIETRLRTAPPDHVVAGIDANFFVTQAPLKVGDKTTTGWSLFMCVPL